MLFKLCSLPHSLEAFESGSHFQPIELTGIVGSFAFESVDEASTVAVLTLDLLTKVVIDVPKRIA